MSRGLSVDPSDAVPLWKQIEENVRRLVASGALKPGSAMPSVRELARDLSINPATVAKGYQHLVDAGILAVKRGEGTFVAAKPGFFVEAAKPFVGQLHVLDIGVPRKLLEEIEKSAEH